MGDISMVTHRNLLKWFISKVNKKHLDMPEKELNHMKKREGIFTTFLFKWQSIDCGRIHKNI